jgi:CheY-like chemotaxis protein
MRVLLVEDKTDFAESIERATRSMQGVDLVWVASRDSALAALGSETFDLVILDRRIPSADGVLDDHADHGWRVFAHVRDEQAGTPVWFLTGSEDADFAAEINNTCGRQEDIHGLNAPEQMYLVFWKKRLADCVKNLRTFAEQREALERIAIRAASDSPALSADECRTLRIFARRRAGTVIDMKVLGGGLSSARVLKIIVREANEMVRITAVAKVAPLTDIHDEFGRYNTDILRLAPGGFPTLTLRVDAGAGRTGGLFYGMVGSPEVESLFDRLAAGHASVAGLPAAVRQIEQPWYLAKQAATVTVGQIRRAFIGDPQLHAIQAELGGIEISAIETRTVQVARCCQHNDLHCSNVVFDNTDRAMVIDFGDAGLSYAAVDPVTMELSTIFHMQHTRLPPGWPTEAAMSQWPEIDVYTEGCAFRPFIGACREWASGEAASPQEVFAVAYGYALRQLKYADTDKALARALIRTCIARLVPA